MHFVMVESGRRFEDGERLMAEDIAYRAALAIDNGRLYQEAREADRRKDEFLAVLSHELRTPLAPLMTWVELLRRAPDPVRAARRRRDRAERPRPARAHQRAARPRRDHARQSVARREAVNAADAPRCRGHLDASANEKGVRLECRVLDADLPVNADATRLEQIFSNLLSNAIKFTPGDGVVSATAERDADWAVVRIKDTGIGIAPAFLPQVFEMFKQHEEGARRSHGGLGIGLALAKRLTELHRGVIHATSPGLGRGAEFVVRLPLHAEGAEPLHGTPSVVEDTARPLEGLSVLVVEDAPDTREAIRDVRAARCARHGRTARRAAFERLAGSVPTSSSATSACP
jgi:signal transduction histidine kinase